MTDATPDRSAPETVPVVEKMRDEACDDLVATVRDALAELAYMSRHAYRVGGHRERGEAALTVLASRLEQAEQAVRDDREVWSFDTLVYVAQRLLDEQYPPEVFTGASGDPGPALVVALRDALAGLAGGDQ